MENDLLSGLEKCTLFAGLTRNDLPRILESIDYTVIEKKKGEIIANTGEKCVNAYILVKGCLAGKLYNSTGQCVRVRTLNEGIIPAIAFIFANEKKYPVTLEALTDVKLLCINHNCFEQMIISNTLLMKNLVMIMANNVAFYSKKIRMLSFSLKERLWEYLMELKKSQKSDSVKIPMSRQQLGEFLGVQKNSIQRCLVELKNEGLIDFDKREIRILKTP